MRLLAGAVLALTSAWAIAQDGPESLLPPGFDRPTPRPSPTRAASDTPANAPSRSAPSVPRIISEPVIQALPGSSPSDRPSPPVRMSDGKQLPSLRELQALSPDELTDLLGLKPTADVPASARRSLTQVGVLDEQEGGLPAGQLVGQDAALVRAALAGNDGMLVSRWGHILLRRALASRLDAPAAMNPADFAALRAALLLRMGESAAARAVVQDVDVDSYTPGLTDTALDTFVASSDLTGICPAVAIRGGTRKDGQWQVISAICGAFQGNGGDALRRLDRAQYRGVMPKVDMLLAQKYAGASGRARRAVKIEWDDVAEMTPWRYGLSLAVGLNPPRALTQDASPWYDYIAATAPMLGLADRAAAADRAAGAGVLSSAAMVDLYSQIYTQDDVAREWSEQADTLRNAYVAATPADRMTAIRSLWGSGSGAAGEAQRYSRQVLTAYAAARLPVDQALAPDAAPLIASMLTAGLDRNALRWAGQADVGSDAWALLALAAPTRDSPVAAGALDTFRGQDASAGARRTGFLLAGLAGLGRVSPDTARSFAEDNGITLSGGSRWTQLIDQAARVDNTALVALLAGLGMQGGGWDKMTPRHLYHIVAALRRVGLESEARMIAAEAVARG